VASARHVGILNAIPNLVSAVFQLKSADVTEKMGSRKRTINTFVFLQAVMLVPIALLALFKGGSPISLIVLVTLFNAFGAFATPAWASLMADLVPGNKRGQYFGWRNKVLGFVLVAASFIAGLILHQMKKFNVFLGFFLVFILAFLFRLFSWHFLRKMHEPPLSHDNKDHFTLFQFLARIKESNFARFVVFVSAMNFSVNLASPYFAVLMLRDLHFSYLLYTLINITAHFTVYLMMGRWGKHADKVGNLKVMRVTAPLIAILPLLWVIHRNPIYLILVQIVSGFAWSGFNLCASNFIYDAVSPQKRTRCVAYFNVLNGLALCTGALLGGFIVWHLPPLLGYKILTLFVISSALRLLVGLWLSVKLKEVRRVEKARSEQLFFSVLGMRPLADTD